MPVRPHPRPGPALANQRGDRPRVIELPAQRDGDILHIAKAKSTFPSSRGAAMPLPESVPRASRTLAREDAYGKLRGWIIDGTLKPEESLNDQKIGAALGV